MLAKRIIPCLDIKDGQVIKGIQFRDHQLIGDIVPLAQYYSQAGADELVIYDITASTEQRTVDKHWVSRVADAIQIPLCIAGGIRSVSAAGELLALGATKISINSPALQDPSLINRLVDRYGSQRIVVGIDSWHDQQQREYRVYQFTGDPQQSQSTQRNTLDWVTEVQQRGAGEIVLNMMNQDGVRQGYDIEQLQQIRHICHVPLIASGGAGTMQHFWQAFQLANVDGALAASVFHQRMIHIAALKQYLQQQGVKVKTC